MATTPNVSMAPIDDIHPEDNPRRTFDPADEAELEASVRRRGVIAPLIVRRLKEGLGLIDGERRLGAARKAGLKEVPVIIRTLSDDEAREERLIANLQRVNLPVMEESAAFQALLKGRTLDDVAAIACKDRRYVRERLLLMELVPDIQGLVAKAILPLAHAVRLARVPAPRQKEAVDECFFSLFNGKDKGQERYQRESVRPLRDLDQWMNRNLRLDLKSPDVALFQPELVDQVQKLEAKKDHLLLHLSTHRRHMERSNPPLLLASQWRYANSKEERCRFARDGVIELGDGRGQVISVCVAKEECKKHWPRQKSTNTDERAKRAEEERQRTETAKRHAAAERRWKEQLKPEALAQLTSKVRRATLTRDTLNFLLGELSVDTDELVKYVGPLAKLPNEGFVGVLIIGAAIRHGWRYEAFRPIAKRFGLRLMSPTTKTAGKPSAAA